MKLSHLLGTIIVSALSSAGALDHKTLPLKNSLDPKVILPAPDVQAKGEHSSRHLNTAWTLVAIGTQNTPSSGRFTHDARGDINDCSENFCKLSDLAINALDFDILKYDSTNQSEETIYFDFRTFSFDSTRVTLPGDGPAYSSNEADAMSGNFIYSNCNLYQVCNFGAQHCGGTLLAAWGFQGGGGPGSCSQNRLQISYSSGYHPDPVYIYVGKASPTTAPPPTTASPTTASPTTTSPTTSPTESSPWEIEFKSLNIDFNASTTNEGLILTYEIGKGKTHASSLYAGPCIDNGRTMPTIKSTGVVTKKEDLITDSANPLMTTLELGYNVNKSLIATSNIWNDTTSQMKFCQVLQLVEETSQIEDDLVIIEDIRDVTIGINSFLNFSLGVDLVGAIVNAVNQTTSLVDFIYAYICSGDDAMSGFDEDFELEPNEDLHVCFMSKSTDVEISQVTSMVIEGTDASGSTTELPVVAGGIASIKSITSLRYVNATSVICTTRVPINMFDYELADAKITIKGSIAMNLQADVEERKLLIEDQVSTKNRDLQQLDNDMDEEAQFGISVNLKRSDIVREEQILFLNSASKIFASIVPLVVVAYAVW